MLAASRAIMPVLPAAAYKTYHISAPFPTHWRSATCEEVSCSHFISGWQTVIDESTELGQQQAHFIRHDRSRRYSEEKEPAGLTCFTFGPGQRCYSADEHRVKLDRTEHYRVTGGDWRGNPRGESYTHVRPEDWVEDCALHQDKLATRLAQG